ncbi:MAG: hypothetical protein ABIG85_03315, partial [Chloroflexota bacterium]
MSYRLHDDPDRVVFALDFETVESVGGVKYLIDRGPNGFNFEFPAAAGSQPTEQLDGSYYFDGADYLSLPAAQLARFYEKMPTGEHTWIVLASTPGAGVGGSATMFSCYNNGAAG